MHAAVLMHSLQTTRFQNLGLNLYKSESLEIKCLQISRQSLSLVSQTIFQFNTFLDLIISALKLRMQFSNECIKFKTSLYI